MGVGEVAPCGSREMLASATRSPPLKFDDVVESILGSCGLLFSSSMACSVRIFVAPLRRKFLRDMINKCAAWVVLDERGWPKPSNNNNIYM